MKDILIIKTFLLWWTKVISKSSRIT